MFDNSPFKPFNIAILVALLIPAIGAASGLFEAQDNVEKMKNERAEALGMLDEAFGPQKPAATEENLNQ